MATFYPSSNDYFQHDMVTKNKSLQPDSLYMISLVYLSGLPRPGDLNPTTEHIWVVVQWEVRSNYVIRSCQHGPESWRNVSDSNWNPCNTEWRLLQKQSWVPPSISMVFLIKCIREVEEEAKLRKLNPRKHPFYKLNKSLNIVPMLQLLFNTLHSTPNNFPH